MVCGTCALLRACLGALCYRERDQVAVLAGLVVAGMTLMVGPNTPLVRMAYDLIPGISRFRLCFRYVSWARSTSTRSSASRWSTIFKAPLSTQLWNRRKQVAYGEYGSGMSAHGAPVRSTQNPA